MMGAADAQLRGVKADVVPFVGSDGVHAGADARAALWITLPEGFHVQSNKPRDPLLIPTELAIDAPAGVTVAEVVFPAPVDFKSAGSDQPLAVFERSFAIGVRLAVGAGVPPGDIRIPARVRYQACDETTCFAPTTVAAESISKIRAGICSRSSRGLTAREAETRRFARETALAMIERLHE